MTLMNCRRAEKLMPLYAAGDLPAGRRRRAVAAHVAGCASCAALAAEFRASREWARAAGDVPEFGDEFYEGLRAGVLDEINRDTRPSAPERPLPFFPALFAGRRLAYAASLALAACALALSLYLGRDASRPRRDDVARTPPAVNSIRPPQPAPVAPPPGAEQRPSPDAPPDERRTTQPRRAGGTFKRTPTLRRPTPPPDAATRVLTAAADDAARQGASSANDAAGHGTATQGVAQPALREGPISVARIEMQTADPNIRIIWLASAAGADDEPDAAAPERVDPER